MNEDFEIFQKSKAVMTSVLSNPKLFEELRSSYLSSSDRDETCTSGRLCQISPPDFNAPPTPTKASLHSTKTGRNPSPTEAMAQGAIKTKPATGGAKSGRRQNVAGAKKGARTIAPRKAALVKNGKITKVCAVPPSSAGLSSLGQDARG